MAFNIRFNLNHAYLQNMNLNLINGQDYMNLENNRFTRMAPEQASQLLPELNYHQFANLLQDNPFFPYDIESDTYELNLDYYYIVYLICCRRFDDARDAIVNVNNYIQEYNYNIEDDNIHIDNIINFRHMAFNGSTIIHHALQWGATSDFVRWLREMGGDMEVQNDDGVIPGADVHLTIWINPFALYFNMPIVLREPVGERRIGIRHRNDFYLGEIINNRAMRG